MKNNLFHRIAIYIRVSTEEQAANPEGSIKNQEERLRQAVVFKNLEGRFGEITGVFIDPAYSGKDTKRPELQRLLRLIEKKEFTLLMVTELSRLSRSIRDFAGIWEMMQKHDCGFMSLRENFDTTTAAGEMVLYSIANIAQFERRQVSERVSANFEARSKRGLYNGGVIPIGLKPHSTFRGHLEIDAAHAEIVKNVFDIYLREENLLRAAKKLNALGITRPTQTIGGGSKPRLSQFTAQNLRDLLTNKAYIGIRKFKVKGVVHEVKATWDPIIEPNTFNLVQEIISKNKRRKPETESRYPFLLSGLIQCDQCKERLVGKSAHGNVGKVPYYEHGWTTAKESCLQGNKKEKCFPYRISAKKVESTVWAKVLDVIQSESTQNEILIQAKKLFSESKMMDEQKKTEKLITQTEQKINSLVSRLTELPKNISPQPIFEEMQNLQTKQAHYKAVLLEQKTAQQSTRIPSEIQFKNYLASLQTMDWPENKHKILGAMVQKILIQKEGLELKLYVDRERIHQPLGVIPGVNWVSSNEGG